MFGLKDFQKIAIDELSNTFLNLWRTGNYRLPITFKAPTGAGKTVMMAEFLRCLDDNYQFQENKAYLWISFGGDESYSQSKNKFYQYFNEGTDMNLKDISNLTEGKLYKNNIFFINWAKIKGTNKESKILRKDNENTIGNYGIFDEYIKNTLKERDLVLIIDEAHTESDSTLADEVVDLINPRIIIKVTATPKEEPSISDIKHNRAGYVEVLEEDVINSGLIKEKIIIQTEEDIHSIKNNNLTEDELLLELAYNKREELKNLYQELELDINPLVLIQLPSDEKEKESVSTNKKDGIISYLMEKGVKESEIAIWLSNEKKNLESVEKNNSNVNFMIFKVAPATGWDCPRADILVMYREIKSPTFHTQIIGRIKRMPDGHHYKEAEQLNKAYIYTNYNKEHIRNVKQTTNPNKIPVYFSKLKDGVETIRIETVFRHRTDFNTLTPPPLWQSCCLKSLDKYFGIDNTLPNFSLNRELVKNKMNLQQNFVQNKIVVNAEIDSFDSFVSELKEKSSEIDYSFSRIDIERLYNLLCFDELKKQEINEAKYNPSRSWAQLKSALNVWFKTRFGEEKGSWYDVIVNELLTPTSNLKKAIHQALLDFRVKYDITIREKNKSESFEINIPEQENSFDDTYEELQFNKNVYDKFYLKKQYKGRENELKFIKYLENMNIDWWHKQEDSGKSVFAIEYYDTQEKKYRLFNPDFIVKKDNMIYILDTKAGQTAKSKETEDKSNALQKWIKENESKYSFKIIGGIIEYKHPNWKINKQLKYVYENSNDWECFDI